MAINVVVKWKVKTCHKFNALASGKLFKQNKESIVAVGEDGIVQVYEMPSSNLNQSKVPSIMPIRNFETKCGSASHILLKDVTRLSPCDMLVADTRGAVVLFCDGQILVRRCSLTGKTSRVVALEVQETGLGNVQVIVGKDDGELICFNTFSQLWKLRLSDIARENMKKNISVACVMATAITTSSGDVGDYVLVSDTDGYLHVIEHGEVLASLRIGTVVTTMAPGIFLLPEDASRQPKCATQIALGCMDGCVWILVDFSLDISAPYANIGHPITHLRRVPHHPVAGPPIGGSEGEVVDLLVCGGHFNSLKIFQHGKMVNSFPLCSWPMSICGVRDWIDFESRAQQHADDSSILIGCQDSTLQCISVNVV